MRRQNFQTVSWFYDIYKRDLLNLDPPYQRRSVWNQDFKDFFIDTLLLNYPAPALFMYEEINPNGVANYNVVDGKQRLSTVFDFVDNRFPVSEKALISEMRGKYFDELEKDVKVKFWNYSFLVEYLPTSDESIINNIFDRINRNVARLTAQELRHAKYSGAFISAAEELADIVNERFNNSIPRIAQQSRKQMKDVELIAQILLMLEEGPKGYTSEELDVAFNDRDIEWAQKESVKSNFMASLDLLSRLIEYDTENFIKTSRLSNQADYYSLMGVLSDNIKNGIDIAPRDYLAKLKNFIQLVENEEERANNPNLESYYQNARVATNRTSARKDRMAILKEYILS